MSNRQAKPREMTPEMQRSYDATLKVLTAISFIALVALGLTVSFNLATPITHLEPVSPFAVFGFIGFLELAAYEVKVLWRSFR